MTRTLTAPTATGEVRTVCPGSDLFTSTGVCPHCKVVVPIAKRSNPDHFVKHGEYAERQDCGWCVCCGGLHPVASLVPLRQPAEFDWVYGEGLGLCPRYFTLVREGVKA